MTALIRRSRLGRPIDLNAADPIRHRERAIAMRKLEAAIQHELGLNQQTAIAVCSAIRHEDPPTMQSAMAAWAKILQRENSYLRRRMASA